MIEKFSSSFQFSSSLEEATNCDTQTKQSFGEYYNEMLSYVNPNKSFGPIAKGINENTVNLNTQLI